MTVQSPLSIQLFYDFYGVHKNVDPVREQHVAIIHW